MAKIYETKDDVSREAASEKIRTSGLLFQLSALVTGLGIGSLIYTWRVSPLRTLPAGTDGFFARTWKTLTHSPDASNNAASAAIEVVAGMLGMGYTFKKGMEGQAVRDELGHEHIIGPCCAEKYIHSKNGHADRIAQQQTTTQTAAREL